MAEVEGAVGVTLEVFAATMHQASALSPRLDGRGIRGLRGASRLIGRLGPDGRRGATEQSRWKVGTYGSVRVCRWEC